MRADNRGEGGILALMALAQRVSVGTQHPARARHRRYRGRLLVLRRRSDHPGDLGAFGCRRPRSRRTRVQAIRAADLGGGHHRTVRRAMARHRQRRPGVRPGDGGLVSCLRRARDDRDRRIIPTSCSPYRPATRSPFASNTRRSLSWSSAPSCSASPGPRRCMPIWAISARSRSGWFGPSSCCPAWC